MLSHFTSHEEGSQTLVPTATTTYLQELEAGKASFRESILQVNHSDPAPRYYNARCRQDETAFDYMPRLNNYARNVDIRFDPGQKKAEHVMQFLTTVGIRLWPRSSSGCQTLNH